MRGRWEASGCRRLIRDATITADLWNPPGPTTRADSVADVSPHGFECRGEQFQHRPKRCWSRAGRPGLQGVFTMWTTIGSSEAAAAHS